MVGAGRPRLSGLGPEGVCDAPEQDLAVDRLGGVVRGAEPQGPGLGGRARAAGEKDHRSRDPFVADDSEQLETVEQRHHDVREEQSSA
jgi:hypothetical protein